MWKLSRTLLFQRWSNTQPKNVENTIPSSLSKTLSSIKFAEKKRYSEDDQKQKQKFKQSWNCENMKFLLFKLSFLEKVGWLGTVSVLCFNFHINHLHYAQRYGDGKSYCLLPKNVFATPADCGKHKTSVQSSNEFAGGCLSSNKIYRNECTEVSPSIHLPESSLEKSILSSVKNKLEIPKSYRNQNVFNNIKENSTPYAAALHYSAAMEYVAKNPEKAYRSFRKAALLGSTQAFYSLGLCFELGKGTKVNLKRAAFCFKTAATKGHGLAAYNLATYFFKGIGGLPIDPEAAKLLMFQAAEEDISEAQLYLGIDYFENSNYPKAFQMFSLFEKKDSTNEKSVQDGKYFLGMCYENGLGTAKNLKTAFEIYSQAATSGHDNSILKLSKFYEEGLGGCKQDLDFSTALFQMLTDQTSVEWKKTFLRLMLKKEIMSYRNKFINFVGKSESSFHKSTSFPQLSSHQNKIRKTGSLAVLSQSFLDFAISFKSVGDSRSGRFFIGEDEPYKSQNHTFVSHFQMSVPQLMIAKS